QGRTDNSWDPRAIGDHGAPVSLPKLKKEYEKGTRGILWGPLLTRGPRPVPKCSNGQPAPVHETSRLQVGLGLLATGFSPSQKGKKYL
ncbi:unnamed protein product, partial [Staurois parvus]